jgi:hypothetical protein
LPGWSLADHRRHRLHRVFFSWKCGPRRGALFERRRRKPARADRSLALVGKLFPTTDPNHPTPLRTASFIHQEDIGGTRTVSINDAVLRNAPDVTVFRRGPAGTLLIKVASVFRRVDQQPTVRQVYPIAELGKPADEPTRAPAFMQLLVAPGQPVIPGEDLDVRDEIMAHIFDPAILAEADAHVQYRGDRRRQDVRLAIPGAPRVPELAPHRTMVFDNAVISYNGDCVIHFTHPTWRGDRNDPSTATRINGVKGR